MLELSDHSRRAAARNFGENGHFCYMQGGMSEWCGGEGTEPQEGFYRASTGLQRPQSPCRRPLRGAEILAVLCFLCGKIEQMTAIIRIY